MSFRKGILSLGVAALLSWSSTAQAQPEFCNFTNVASDDVANGTTVTCNLVGGYTLGNIDWDGIVTNAAFEPATWGSELRVDVSGPLGSGQIVLGSGQTYPDLSNFTGSSGAFGGGDPAGMWTFDFRESFLDAAAGGTDAEWTNIDLTFNEFIPPTPPNAVDLGDYDGTNKFQGNLTAGEVDWYSFNVTAEDRIQASTSKTLTIPFETRLDDSEIGLYNSLGQLISTNDDIAFPANPYSQVTEILAPGTYYIAIGEFNTVFGPDFGAVTTSTTGLGGGEYFLNLVPEPSTALLLSLGVVGLIRRRR